jgi:hypothetical protein
VSTVHEAFENVVVQYRVRDHVPTAPSRHEEVDDSPGTKGGGASDARARCPGAGRGALYPLEMP